MDDIETYFWECGKRGKQAAFTYLHTRFTLLWCYSGVLRSESLFLGELLDLVDLQLQKKDYTDLMEITVMQMVTGKTVNSNLK